MNAPPTSSRNADLALAHHDGALPCLAAVLDDDRLSELVGEQIHITRVRYKPRTSALVAFRHPGSGKEDHGWALTTADNCKLHGRAQSSASRGGGIRLVRPDPRHGDDVVAIGGITDDWALRKNLRWLGNHGLERLGVVQRPGYELLSGDARVLRYKPERRLVLMEQTPTASIVIKIAAQSAHDDLDRLFQQRLEQHGVPVLPRLGDAGCSRHGISASPAWGDRDLVASDDQEGARRAGEALARLHGIPAQAKSWPARFEDLQWQITATYKMVGTLLPALDGPAALVADRIRRQLEDRQDSGAEVLVHGDFSADQVLIGGSEVRLIDFDRAHNGATEVDLGSFAAVEEMSRWRGHAGPVRAPHTDHLIDGYVRSGGQFSPAAMDAWAAFRMFSSSVDPFRDRTPEWAADISRHLDRASELVP
ncbi:MAG: aminoglycoside phosphotransferase family protein [Arthrobacter sp.]|nr:aminoglycoside phosphotransferase family protein [Arthrobacter sp.]MCU1549101.1 aminoglycoside phosphotransferase family protein [Arthrobacter sp.]